MIVAKFCFMVMIVFVELPTTGVCEKTTCCQPNIHTM